MTQAVVKTFFSLRYLYLLLRTTRMICRRWWVHGMVKIQELDEHRVAGVEGLDLKLYELLFRFSRFSDWINFS